MSGGDVDTLSAQELEAMQRLVDGVVGFAHQHFDGGTFETNALAELDENGRWRTWDMNAPFSRAACEFIAAAPDFVRRALAALRAEPSEAAVAAALAYRRAVDEQWWSGDYEATLAAAAKAVDLLEAEVAALRRRLAQQDEPPY